MSMYSPPTKLPSAICTKNVAIFRNKNVVNLFGSVEGKLYLCTAKLQQLTTIV